MKINNRIHASVRPAALEHPCSSASVVIVSAKRAKKLGKNIPETLLKAVGVTGVPGIAAQLDTMLKLVEANAANLLATGLKPILAAGQSLVDGIKAIDAEQEVKRLKALPEAVRNFYYHKGLLYIGLKVINDAGRELHAHDPSAAAKYNLSILYRNAHKKKSAAKDAAK
jgi:hypothetical protein